MSDAEESFVTRRSIGRRREDRAVRVQIHRHHQLFEVGRTLTSIMDFDRLFEVVMEQTNQVMASQRSTVFLYDRKTDQLFSMVATGLKRNQIRIPADRGVAGWVFRNRQPLTVPDAYADARFYPDVDSVTGYQTRNLVCVPLFDKKGECFGALQALNKISGAFNDDDCKLLTSLSHYVAIGCENARLYEELRALDKAKERVINHLAHELKTPLALIAAVFSRFSRELEAAGAAGIEKARNRGARSLKRLLELQAKIEDILDRGAPPEKALIVRFIEDAAAFVEEAADAEPGAGSEFLNAVCRRIESLYGGVEFCPEKVPLSEFLHDICDRAAAAASSRELALVRTIAPGLTLTIDRNVLAKVCGGLLKNAIENTPDEGRVEVVAEAAGGKVRIRIHDWGVGITDQNRTLIFGGFFHTQPTDLYASRQPYDFNAGGSGSDLLRIKVFSERYGFDVDFDSVRCKFLPGDGDVCPGRISRCPFVLQAAECLRSGGSVFTVGFPREAATT